MLSIALIGYGYWGPNVARNIYGNKHLDFKYICDLKTDRLELARNLYADSVAYTTDYEAVLSDESVDVIVLAVETSAHFELARKAILQGKHVYIEKPITNTVREAEELKTLAEEHGVLIHVDHIMVYHPAIMKIRSLIQDGVLGDVIYYDCSRVNLGQVKNDVSCMWDLSVHDLSIIDYLSDGEPVEKVEAIGKKIYSAHESVSFMNLCYSSFIANIKANWISPIKERRMIIAGTKKMLVYDDVDVLNKLIIYDKGFDVVNDASEMEYADFVVKSRTGDGLIPTIETGDALYNSIEHFRRCIMEGQESLSGPDSAIRILRILEMADDAMVHGGQ